MKKIIILSLLSFLVTGCLHRERVEERDKSRTDSALVAIERLIESDSTREEIESLKEEINLSHAREEKALKLQKVKSVRRNPDTLFLERTITYVYSKGEKGSDEELVLDSIHISIDSCFHYYIETKKDL